LPSSKDSRKGCLTARESWGRIHRTDEPTEPAKLLAIEAVDSNAATLITLDEK